MTEILKDLNVIWRTEGLEVVSQQSFCLKMSIYRCKSRNEERKFLLREGEERKKNAIKVHLM